MKKYIHIILLAVAVLFFYAVLTLRPIEFPPYGKISDDGLALQIIFSPLTALFTCIYLWFSPRKWYHFMIAFALIMGLVWDMNTALSDIGIAYDYYYYHQYLTN